MCFFIISSRVAYALSRSEKFPALPPSAEMAYAPSGELAPPTALIGERGGAASKKGPGVTASFSGMPNPHTRSGGSSPARHGKLKRQKERIRDWSIPASPDFHMRINLEPFSIPQKVEAQQAHARLLRASWVKRGASPTVSELRPGNFGASLQNHSPA